MAMSTTTVSCKLLCSTYNIAFDGDIITTMLTREASVVDKWIQEVEKVHRHRLHKLIVGLDVEIRPNGIPKQKPYPVAILQLCVGRRCLIFQLIHADEIPLSLYDFLSNEKYTFVGVGINADVEKLKDDYDLMVSNALDLPSFAAKCLNKVDLKKGGLKSLARDVLGKEVEKPRPVSWSEWDKEQLSDDQVQYACVDALLSFRIGRFLKSKSSNYLTGFVSPVLLFGMSLLFWVFLYGLVRGFFFGLAE